MKYFFSICLVFVVLIYACKSDTESSVALSDAELNRIVLVGGTLISSMENHAFFESAMTAYLDHSNMTFRNIGWPADDVFGLARSQFGSAQNTKSWQPPSAEEGFGSKVLTQHIEEADPSTLIIGYGTEVANSKSAEDFELFKSGYKRLLEYVDSLSTEVILLSPPRHEKNSQLSEEHTQKNEWLSKARDFIQSEAEERNHIHIDLYEELITNPDTTQYTDNGALLNEEGYKRLSQILIEHLIPSFNNTLELSIDTSLAFSGADAKLVKNQNSTLYGTRFTVQADKLNTTIALNCKEPIAIYVDGQLKTKNQDTLSSFSIGDEQLEKLSNTIKEKNRLYRYKLRPLNEAYIYLFRQHEMGHLSYEMDDLARLVEEKESEIQFLKSTSPHYIELEKIKPWKAPKQYAYDEVPTNIPIPNIQNELEAFKISEGMELNLFAADPMIANPIDVNWDTKGRAWVATSSTYPHIVPGREPSDKIIILEDTDGDGRADKHTVFAEDLLVPHSVLPVEGGAYVTATTELLFLEDTNGDDIADKRTVIYDGFGNADIHHTIHGLKWTPWGDLHFTQSIYINTFIESAFGTKILNGAGTWAMNPYTEELKVFSRGLVNPWGEAFDEWGQAFATDGAGGSGINYIFPESAHQTAVGEDKTLPGLNSNTPKNTGAELIYSRHLPASWQGDVITNDYRANRTVRYKLRPEGSAYHSEEVETILQSEHRSYRPVDNKVGPDGALYIVDWYNPIIDHGEVDFHHPVRDKTHGRIWRMTQKGKATLPAVNMKELSTTQVLNHLKTPEQHTRLQANRAIVERGTDPQAVLSWLRNQNQFDRNYERTRLEVLWLLTALEHHDEALLNQVVNSRNYHARAGALRMLGHTKQQESFKNTLAKAIKDNHPQVRLEALHALREMGTLEAAEMAIQSLDQKQDNYLEFALFKTLRQLKDAWLPVISSNSTFRNNPNKKMHALLTIDDTEAVAEINALINNPKLSIDLEADAWRKLARLGDEAALTKVLAKAVAEEDLNLLSSLVRAPQSNTAIPSNTGLLSQLIRSDSSMMRTQALKLIGRWKVTDHQSKLSDYAEQAETESERLAAMEALIEMDKLEEVKSLASSDNEDIASAACAAWIEEDQEAAVSRAVELLPSLDSTHNVELIIKTFRKINKGPETLTAALQGKTLPEEIANIGIRLVQSTGLNLFDLEKVLREAGNIERVDLNFTQDEKEALLADAIENGDYSHGRRIYRYKGILCGSCHRIRNEGGFAGPELSLIGTFMTPAAIFEAVINPNADIKQNYETMIITKKDGEVLSGLLHRKTSDATLLRLSTSEIESIPNSEIESSEISPNSLMPPGLVGSLSKNELRDLMHYLIKLGT